MLKRRVAYLASLVISIAMAGCAHKPSEATGSLSLASAVDAPQLTISPDNPDDIIALGKRLTQYRLSQFSVTQNKFTFYVGGVLMATYENATKILRISSLAPEDNIGRNCEYTPQGALFVDTEDQSKKESLVSECDKLALRLNDYLSR